MSDIEILGRAVAIEFPSATQAPSGKRAHDKSELSLLEANAVADVPIHALKAAIYDGTLPASRRGRCVVKRVELDGWLRENWQLLNEPSSGVGT